MPAFDYAVIRLVPRVEREEFVNVGVVLFCADREWLSPRFALDESRVRALHAAVDLELVGEHLDAFARAAAGEGPIGSLPLRERWSWLVAPRSTILQTSAPHAGLCDEPERALEALLDRYVR